MVLTRGENFDGVGPLGIRASLGGRTVCANKGVLENYKKEGSIYSPGKNRKLPE